MATTASPAAVAPLASEHAVVDAPTKEISVGERSRTLFKELHPVGGTVAREVFVRFKVNDIKYVSEADGTAKVDFNVYLRWIDPALIGAVAPAFRRTVAEYESLWNPKVEINNAVELEELWDGDISWNLTDTKTGAIKYSQRYRGLVSNRMDLRAFPFDSDEIVIRLGSAFYDEARVQLVKDPVTDSTLTVGSLDEWTVAPTVWVNTIQGNKSPSTGRHFSNIDLCIIIQRNFGFYLWKVVLVQTLISAWSWVVFFMPPDQLDSRMSVTLTLFLASVAFLFVINDKLPRVSYLTYLDRMTMSNFVLLFFTAIESFIVFLLSDQGQRPDSEAAKAVDMWSAILFPSSTLIVDSWVIFLGLWRRTRVQRALQRTGRSSKTLVGL